VLLLVSLACAGCEQPAALKPAPQPLGAAAMPTPAEADRQNPAAISEATKHAAGESVTVGADKQVARFASSATRPLNRPSAQSIDERLLFFPAKYPDGDWQPEGLNYSGVLFTAVDGVRIHGWYCPCENPRAVVLYAHGNAGNITHRADVLRLLQRRLRATVLIFDYRGYGRSEGVPTVEGILNDARAARTFLARQAGINESDLVLIGNSLGGAVAVQLAAEKRPRALVLENTFSSLKDIAAHHYPALAWLVSAKKLNSSELIASYSGPLLQCHGDADRTIPFTLGEKLFAAANDPKQFVKIPGGDHNDWLPDEYYSKLDALLGK
jgi:pimeloyl-ACP methyl ester carboxylesterase